MKKRLLGLIASILICVGIQAQTDTSKFNVALNLAPLYSGSPELQVDYYFNNYVGTSLNFGTTFLPRRGVVSVGEDLKLIELRGNYFKLGLKFRLALKGLSEVVPYAQIFYVGSTYYERARFRLNSLNSLSSGYYEVTTDGYVNAIAFVLGADIKIVKHINVRLGAQFGFYKRNDHLGNSNLTLQPGLGSVAFASVNQAIIGVCYKFSLGK